MLQSAACSFTTEPSFEGELVSPSPVCNVSHWPAVDFYVWAEVSLCVTDVHRTSPLAGGSWRSKSRVATSTQRPHLALQPLPNWFTVATTRPTQVSRDEHSNPLRLSLQPLNAQSEENLDMLQEGSLWMWRLQPILEMSQLWRLASVSRHKRARHYHWMYSNP